MIRERVLPCPALALLAARHASAAGAGERAAVKRRAFAATADPQQADAEPASGTRFWESRVELGNAMAHLSFGDRLFVAQLGDFTDRAAGSLGKALPVLRQPAMPAHHVLRNRSLRELTEAVPAKRKLDCP